MIDFDSATELEALSFDNIVGVFAGSDEPSGSAPIGSVYIRTNGQIWQKAGPNDEDWSVLSLKKSVFLIRQRLELGETEEMRVSGARIEGNGHLKLSGTLRISS